MGHDGKGLSLRAFDLLSLFFHRFQDFLHPLLKLPDGQGIAGMEGQGNHTLHLGQINVNQAVIPDAVLWHQLLVGILSSMLPQILPGPFIRTPDT